MGRREPPATLHALVSGVVDYAGLFPPAALSLRDAVAGYAEYLASSDAWMLGRFVVPASRLAELAAEAAPYTTVRAAPWRLTALLGDDVPAGAREIAAHNAVHGSRLLVDSVEVRAPDAAAIRRAVNAVGDAHRTYVEIPVTGDPRAPLAAIRAADMRAKVRTGGVSENAFPTAAQLARFIVRCAELEVPFKATAGLHHPLRAEYRLTYAADAPRATMFGFVNLFVAAGFAHTGMSEPDVARVLEERDPSAFDFGADELRWRERSIPLERIAHARASFAIAFGSCSFREPVDDLHHMGFL